MKRTHGPSTTDLAIELDRTADVPLVEQVRRSIGGAIHGGQLKPGARLPSWRDLATQLGVARGTVREAYDRLLQDELVVTSGPAGTHVARRPPEPVTLPRGRRVTLADNAFELFSNAPLPFQMGAPAQDAFPAKLWSRIHARAAREQAFAPTSYADPLGELALREQLAAYLAVARGLRCGPEQIVITGGFRSGLHLVLRALHLDGRQAWMEEPGFFLTRQALEIGGMRPVLVDVDDDGLDVAQGATLAPNAALAVVTAGQQSPLGSALSTERRLALLRWAKHAGAWIIEDDYLSELQLAGRAAPALAASDPAARVIHLGTFSKTLSPALGVGFVVVPAALAARFAEAARSLAAAPGTAVQAALVELFREGHYIRHLRKMKSLYTARRAALLAHLGKGEVTGLAVLMRLPDGTDDRALGRAALARGIAPVPLSMWHARRGSRRAGLLLGVTNVTDARLADACAQLRAVLSAT